MLIAAALTLLGSAPGRAETFGAELEGFDYPWPVRGFAFVSQGEALTMRYKAIPDMYPKAYRWVEEMRAISEFVGADFPGSRFHDGAAGLYEGLAREDAEAERARLDAFLSER